MKMVGDENVVDAEEDVSIQIPVQGDQDRMSQMFATGIVLSKYDLGTPQKLKESLERNNDDSFTENATRLSEMLLTSPTTAKQLLITNSEFAAK
ncbi:unnamed protein product [Nippostrongylus brasiliensis]|uniref:PSD1 domain-containing protein n=1 Tax=Nippostrongylus brasiliensis TaxID=27835 RepID=A0A0N4Y163_NIPBR|nr:unnamed protein product [Nippostrongylus brasiliensis]